jgi:hypothetical protein
VYYSAEVTPWLTITPSIQAIRSALTKQLDADGEFQDLDTTWLLGVRVGIRF